MVHVSSSDSAGSAGQGALQLHQALKKRGEDSHLFVLNQESDASGIVRYEPEAQFSQRVRRMTRKAYLSGLQKPYRRTRPAGCQDLADDRSPYAEELWDQVPLAEIVHLHSVTDFVDYQTFFSHAFDTPLVWTLHDMIPFTGGCRYDLGCGRYRDACGFCPQLGSNRANDFSRKVHRRKQEALDFLNPNQVRIVAVSGWLASLAADSSLLGKFDVSHIPYGIDPEAFHPRDRLALRAALGIDPDAFVVLVELTDVENPRRGIRALTQALDQVSGSRQKILLSIGDNCRPLDGPFRHISLGHFTSDEMRSLFYSAGDCFLNATFQEAFDLSGLEAMACATPVIAFATGGIPEIVKPDETGLLARLSDVSDLTGKIQWMMDHPERGREMGENARLLVTRDFSAKSQADRYAALYDELEVTPSIPPLEELCP